jgi:selenocysteine-specific elongation factor
MPTDLILGTAGHIDHGKTALVQALTGVNTDRLPAEKERGITIDLGFAELDLGDYRLGIVDVPGHERFIRNMLAGATGIDLALLVVAADDSIMPQTREHLEVLRLLRLKAGVIALTKCDLAEPDWVKLVEDDVRGLVADTFLADAPLVCTSATTGAGLDALRHALLEACRRVARPSTEGPFRMPIDRSFVMQGHGTVVTGSVSSGRVGVGEELALEPGGVKVRVRGIQNHDRPVDEVHRGQRAAVNLGGVHHREIVRGQELAATGYLRPSRVMSVRLSVLKSSPWPLKHRARVRFHLGTAELLASVALLDADQLAPGESGLAQLFMSEPAVAIWGQPFVLRNESPMVTMGGGQVLQPAPRRLRRRQPESTKKLNQLWSEDRLARTAAALWFNGLDAWTPYDLCRDAGTAPDEVDGCVEQLRAEGVLVELPVGQRRLVQLHRECLEALCDRVERALAELHAEHPLQSRIERRRLNSRFDYLGDDALVQALINQLIRSGRVQGDDARITLKGHGPQLSAAERRLLEQMVEVYRTAGFQPPDLKALAAQADARASAVPELVALLAGEGQLVPIGDGLYLHAEWERSLREKLREALAAGEGLTVSQIRDLLEVSRKYAVPYCEYLDRIGLTRREGDLRVLA